MKDKKLLVQVFKLASGKSLQFKDFAGNKIILYFYPKDNTPGCTTQALEFTQLKKAFNKLGYNIYGISRDSVASHDKFVCQHNLEIELISDPDETLCKAFDVIKEKNMYGKKVLGIERSTFVLNEKIEVVHEFRKVKALGHAETVLKFLQDQ